MFKCSNIFSNFRFNVLLDFESNPEDIEWLEENVDPWDEVEIKWERTLSDRKALFENKEFSIHDYFKQFPCLRMQRGISLVNLALKRIFCTIIIYIYL